MTSFHNKNVFSIFKEAVPRTFELKMASCNFDKYLQNEETKTKTVNWSATAGQMRSGFQFSLSSNTRGLIDL